MWQSLWLRSLLRIRRRRRLSKGMISYGRLGTAPAGACSVKETSTPAGASMSLANFTDEDKEEEEEAK